MYVTARASERSAILYGVLILSVIQVETQLGFAQTLPLPSTTGPSTSPTAAAVTPPVGLSGADIGGIVVGAVFLVVLVALHTLCCGCSPKRWMNTKSYLVGNSFGTSTYRAESVRTIKKGDPELGSVIGKINDVPPPYQSVAGSTEIYPNDDGSTSSLGSPENVTVNGAPATNEPHSHEGLSHGNTPKQLDVNPGKFDAEECEPVKPEDNPEYPTSSKKIKRFGVKRRGMMDKSSHQLQDDLQTTEIQAGSTQGGTEEAAAPPGDEVGVVYVELDLPVVDDEQIPPLPPKESRTVYAEIKH